MAPLAFVKHLGKFDFQALLSFEWLVDEIHFNEKPTLQPIAAGLVI